MSNISKAFGNSGLKYIIFKLYDETDTYNVTKKYIEFFDENTNKWINKT